MPLGCCASHLVAPEPAVVDISSGSTSTPQPTHQLLLHQQPEPELQNVHSQTPHRHKQATGTPGIAAQCPRFFFYIIPVIGMCAQQNWENTFNQ